MELIHGDAPLTGFLMVMIAIFSIRCLLNESFFLKMMLHPYSVFREKEYYRILTADLVHNDYFHLICNEFLLFCFGGSLEETLRRTTAHGSLNFSNNIFCKLF